MPIETLYGAIKGGEAFELEKKDSIKVGSKEENSSYHLNMITAEYKYNRELNS